AVACVRVCDAVRGAARVGVDTQRVCEDSDPGILTRGLWKYVQCALSGEVDVTTLLTRRRAWLADPGTVIRAAQIDQHPVRSHPDLTGCRERAGEHIVAGIQGEDRSRRAARLNRMPEAWVHCLRACWGYRT